MKTMICMKDFGNVLNGGGVDVENFKNKGTNLILHVLLKFDSNDDNKACANTILYF